MGTCGDGPTSRLRALQGSWCSLAGALLRGSGSPCPRVPFPALLGQPAWLCPHLAAQPLSPCPHVQQSQAHTLRTGTWDEAVPGLAEGWGCPLVPSCLPGPVSREPPPSAKQKNTKIWYFATKCEAGRGQETPNAKGWPQQRRSPTPHVPAPRPPQAPLPAPGPWARGAQPRGSATSAAAGTAPSRAGRAVPALASVPGLQPRAGVAARPGKLRQGVAGRGLPGREHPQRREHRVGGGGRRRGPLPLGLPPAPVPVPSGAVPGDGSDAPPAPGRWPGVGHKRGTG